MEQEKIIEYLRGISEVAGIPISRLEAYSQSNSPFNILEHPRLLDLTDKQYQKIDQLNTFLRAHNTLQVEQTMPHGIENSAQAGKWFQSMIGTLQSMSISLVDYLIANESRYISLAENGLLSTKAYDAPSLDVFTLQVKEAEAPFVSCEGFEIER